MSFILPESDLSIDLSRAELDLMVAPDLETVEAQIMKALMKSEASGLIRSRPCCVPEDRRGSVRSWTCSSDSSATDKIQEREPFTTVAYGLGIVAQETWL